MLLIYLRGGNGNTRRIRLIGVVEADKGGVLQLVLFSWHT